MPPKSSKSAAPAQSWPVLILHQSGDLSETTIQTSGGLTLSAIQNALKRKKGVECVATYKAKTLYLSIFGITEGEDAIQNQHQLPPPHETTALYGDSILVVSKDPKSFEAPIQFKPEQYEEFYTRMFDGGYDSDAEEDADIEGDVQDEVDIEAEVEPDAEADVEEEAEEDEEEDDEEAEVDVEVDAEVDAEDGVEPVPAKQKAKKRKASSKSGAATLLGTGYAYPNPPILPETEQLQEDDTTSNPERQRIIRALERILCEHMNPGDISKFEQSIFRGALHQARLRHVVRTWSYPLFVHIYKMHAHHILSNFHPESYVKNTELYENYQRGDLPLESISAMNTYELFPSNWRTLFEQQQIREKKQLEGNKDRATDQFTCTRCWKKECTYYEMQTRSADEPMTIFITCLNCGKKWRQ